MDPEWLASIVRQCQAAEVPAFVKQDSHARPGQQGRIPDDLWALREFPG
jgi:protein gp37